MANLLLFTEQFDNAVWAILDGGAVTADTTPPPTAFGTLAKLADTLQATPSGWTQFLQAAGKLTSDVGDYTASGFVKKDASTARFPCLSLQFAGTASYAVGINLNTATGETAQNGSFALPAAFGCVDFDATWWRPWLRHADPNANAAVRVGIFPAAASSITGGVNSGLTGTSIWWGANLTPTSAPAAYVPDPFYDADASWTTVAQVAGDVGTFTDMTMLGGYTYEWRVLAANAGGSSASNHPEAYVDGAGPAFGVSRRAGHHTRREVFRTRRV